LQFLLDGSTNLFWQQISSLPTGIYNKGNNQASGAAINQLFVAFVDQPVGTQVRILIDGVLQATAQVVDNTGVVYARFPLRLSQGQDSIEVTIKRSSDSVILATESFATSFIAYLFEIQAKEADQIQLNAVQLEQDATIDGVDPNLLYGKFGVYTGVQRRSDQTLDEYRAQTSCLWQAFQYASMEKGIVDAIKCMLGITVVPVLVPTKSAMAGTIYDNPQWTTVNNIFSEPSPHAVTGFDPDSPHYYSADIAADYRIYPTGYTTTPQVELGPYPSAINPDWLTPAVKQFIIHTVQAVGNEVLCLGIDEVDATVAIVGESVNKGINWQRPVLDRHVNTPPGAPVTGDRYLVSTAPTGYWVRHPLDIAEWNGTNWIFTVRATGLTVRVLDEAANYTFDGSVWIPLVSTVGTDQLANINVATTVTVTQAYIGGVLITAPSASLPVEGADFYVTPLTGAITWSSVSTKIPDTNTIFKVSYSFRLDADLKAVLRRIKPIHKSLVIIFSNVTSDLPVAVEI